MGDARDLELAIDPQSRLAAGAALVEPGDVDVARPHGDGALDDVRGEADDERVLPQGAEPGHLGVRLLERHLGLGDVLGRRQVALGDHHEPQAAPPAGLPEGVPELDRLGIGDGDDELVVSAFEHGDRPAGPDVVRDLAGEGRVWQRLETPPLEPPADGPRLGQLRLGQLASADEVGLG